MGEDGFVQIPPILFRTRNSLPVSRVDSMLAVKRQEASSFDRVGPNGMYVVPPSSIT